MTKLAQIDLDRVRSRGYSFQEEILFWCRQVGCRMGETPIVFENRRAGVSKINQARGRRALRIILQLGVDRPRLAGRGRERPKRTTPRTSQSAATEGVVDRLRATRLRPSSYSRTVT